MISYKKNNNSIKVNLIIVKMGNINFWDDKNKMFSWGISFQTNRMDKDDGISLYDTCRLKINLLMKMTQMVQERKWNRIKRSAMEILGERKNQVRNDFYDEDVAEDATNSKECF